MYSPLICQLDVWQVSNIFSDFVAPPRHLLSQHCTMFRLIMWSKSQRQQKQVFSFLLLSIVSILFPANCSQLCNKTSPIKTLLILLSLVYSHGIYMLLLSSIDWKKSLSRKKLFRWNFFRLISANFQFSFTMNHRWRVSYGEEGKKHSENVSNFSLSIKSER